MSKVPNYYIQLLFQNFFINYFFLGFLVGNVFGSLLKVFRLFVSFDSLIIATLLGLLEFLNYIFIRLTLTRKSFWIIRLGLLVGFFIDSYKVGS